MISTGFFLLLMGLVAFGPKKTIEIAQTLGRLLAQAKRATSQLQEQLNNDVSPQAKGESVKNL